MNYQKKNWFEGHPKTTILLTLIVLLLFGGILLELFLRWYVVYNPSYYTGYRDEHNLSNKIIHFPYGDMPINSEGFWDNEFPKNKTKKRIGYYGDSVCAGVGAGYGYRISEILGKKLPGYDHLNFAGIDNNISFSVIEKIVALSSKHQLDKLIYLMNLNDILPDATGTKDEKVLWIMKYKHYFDWLRGKSYLFTSARYLIRDYYVRLGFQPHGQISYELYPQKYSNILEQTTKRIALFKKKLEVHNIVLIVVIVPYEMQISDEAEKKYRNYGITWEDNFIDSGPQKQLRRLFEKYQIRYLDGINAFIDQENVEKSRKTNKLGEFFVYNKGDALDWNHPNRAGHAKLADYIYKSGIGAGTSE